MKSIPLGIITVIWLRLNYVLFFTYLTTYRTGPGFTSHYRPSIMQTCAYYRQKPALAKPQVVPGTALVTADPSRLQPTNRVNQFPPTTTSSEGDDHAIVQSTSIHHTTQIPWLAELDISKERLRADNCIPPISQYANGLLVHPCQSCYVFPLWVPSLRSKIRPYCGDRDVTYLDLVMFLGSNSRTEMFCRST